MFVKGYLISLNYNLCAKFSHVVGIRRNSGLRYQLCSSFLVLKAILSYFDSSTMLPGLTLDPVVNGYWMFSLWRSTITN